MVNIALGLVNIIELADERRDCFAEINRVLKTGGDFLFSFHVGEEIVHFDKAHDKEIDVDLCFFKTADILKLLGETGFAIIDAIERYPNENMEYATRRGYIWAEKK